MSYKMSIRKRIASLSTTTAYRQQQQQQHYTYNFFSSAAIEAPIVDSTSQPPASLPPPRPSISTSSFANATTIATTTNSSGSSNDHSIGTQTVVQYDPIFVAATRQHVGKTSVSLAIMSGLVKRFGANRVGFMKPVGQKYLNVEDPQTGQTLRIDKDAVLIKSHFELNQLHWSDTSPVLIPPGYTKDYLDSKISYDEQILKVKNALQNIQNAPSDIILCEGTGHCAVGSIIDASNADMASLVNAKMVLVANGGLGNAFDELNLNRNWCLERNVDIAGIIINQIKRDKFEQTVTYLQKAINKWGDNIPLLGCIPDRPFLGCAALFDLERLFDGSLVTGSQHRLRHYRIQEVSLVAHSLEVFLKQLRANQCGRTLYVCHASRSDILLGYLMESVQQMANQQNNILQNQGTVATQSVLESAMVVTGCDETPISTQILEIITSLPKQYAPPVLFTATPTDTVLYNLYKYTPKLNIDDKNRVSTAIAHYEQYINFDLLLQRVQKPSSVSTSTTVATTIA